MYSAVENAENDASYQKSVINALKQEHEDDLNHLKEEHYKELNEEKQGKILLEEKIKKQ